MIIYVFNLLFICSVLLVFTRYCKQDDQLGRYYTSKFGVALVTVSLSVVSALRWEVGTDYRNYTLVFNQIYQMTLSEAINRSGEPLFNSFVWIIMKLTGSPQAVFAVFSFLTVGLIVLSLYRYSAFFRYQSIYMLRIWLTIARLMGLDSGLPQRFYFMVIGTFSIIDEDIW